MDIRKIGNRMTRARKIIFKVLSDSSTPKTAQEIYKKTKDIDLVSVYRNLDLLKKMNLVSECDFGDGKKRYELTNNDRHHHHLICENCGDVKDIEMKEEDLLKKVNNKSNYLIKKHKLEFFGLCPDCQ